MSTELHPRFDSVYRIRANDSGHSYWKYIPGVDSGWIKIDRLDPNSDAFKWRLQSVAAPESQHFGHLLSGQICITPLVDSDIGIVSSNDAQLELRLLTLDAYPGRPIGKKGPSARWLIEKTAHPGAYRIYCADRNGDGHSRKLYMTSDCAANKKNMRTAGISAVYFDFINQRNPNYQSWVFEPASLDPPKPPTLSTPSIPFSTTHGSPGPTSRINYEEVFFSYTAKEAAEQPYDIIVVGTGMGGGIVAGDLFDTNSKLGNNAKSVLVIEKGGLAFHSHCLNAARPAGFAQDRAQQNDTFFSLFKDNYEGAGAGGDWKGGPMYNLGGRSAAWGLFAPRVHDTTLRKHFAPPESVSQHRSPNPKASLADELINRWYREAEQLMNLSLPATTTTHQAVMERLNMQTQRGCQWQWGRVTSEFYGNKNFDFAQGAYSTIDKLLEIAMSKDRASDGTSIEHPNWKILLDTDVREVTWSSDGTTATGVKVVGSDGQPYTIKLKARDFRTSINAALPAVVLAAGSVASPAILMRSGLTDFLTKNGGLHLTDHDIFGTSRTFRYADRADRDRIGAMKLQTYLRPKSETRQPPITLANISIDASSFLPRGPVGHDRVNRDFPSLTVAFIRPRELSTTNTITLNKDGEPVVTIIRPPKTLEDRNDIDDLWVATEDVLRVVTETLHIEILDKSKAEAEAKPNLEAEAEAKPNLEAEDSPTNESQKSAGWRDPFKTLELGGVAHELGTIPMPGANGAAGCVDVDLKLRNKEGVYVCDLSVFPYSPEVNTSLTLAALALRLSRHILHDEPPSNSPPSFVPLGKNVASVMNQTGEVIAVFISDRAGVEPGVTESDRPRALTQLMPGEVLKKDRKHGIFEVAFVYRLTYEPKHKSDFMDQPVVCILKPGELFKIR